MLLASTPAQAQRCGPRAAVLEVLKNRYQEIPVWVGLNGHDTLLELIVSPKGDSWSLLRTFPNGTTCFEDSGPAWSQQRLPKGEQDAMGS